VHDLSHAMKPETDVRAIGPYALFSLLPSSPSYGPWSKPPV
jgi:hypothetical protein